jgi:hypothetical protein
LTPKHLRCSRNCTRPFNTKQPYAPNDKAKKFPLCDVHKRAAVRLYNIEQKRTKGKLVTEPEKKNVHIGSEVTAETFGIDPEDMPGILGEAVLPEPENVGSIPVALPEHKVTTTFLQPVTIDISVGVNDAIGAFRVVEFFGPELLARIAEQRMTIAHNPTIEQLFEAMALVEKLPDNVYAALLAVKAADESRF